MSKYTLKFKLTAIKAYKTDSGGSKAIAHRFCIDHRTLRQWIATYNHHGSKGL
ncbi:helix-turn-helix domain-containing protein [Pragia fontium]|uniref:helix-turn-helix domain-containing protein n=1 Tax=Pragia fontium TaxID=82985 RepID=UPI0009E6582E